MSDTEIRPMRTRTSRWGSWRATIPDRNALVSRLTLIALAAAAGITILRIGTELQGRRLDHGVAATGVLLMGLLMATLLGQYAKRRSHRRGMALLIAQAVLTYLPVLIFDEIWLSALGLLLGVVLTSLPRPAALLAATSVTASGPVVIFCLPVDNRTAIYVAARTLVVGLVVYGIVRLASVAAQAQAARSQTARLAVYRERVRIAQDLHDLVASALSAIAVKSEGAARTTGDPVASHKALMDIAGLARQALGEVRDLAHGQVALSLAQEFEAARATLEAASVRVRITQTGASLPDAVENCFGAVLRESVTNVLRHSQARTCAIVLGLGNGTAELSIENDGVGAHGSGPSHDGTGLANLTVRVAALGGNLTVSGPTSARATEPGRRFRIDAVIPVAPYTPELHPTAA